MDKTTEELVNTRISVLKDRVDLLQNSLIGVAQSALLIVEVCEGLNRRVAALETGHVYIEPTGGGVPGTTGDATLQHLPAISAGLARMAQDSGDGATRH